MFDYYLVYLLLGLLSFNAIQNVNGRFLEKQVVSQVEIDTKLQAFLKNYANDKDSQNFIKDVKAQLCDYRKHAHHDISQISNLKRKKYDFAKLIKNLRKDDDEEPFEDIGDINRGLENVLYDGDIILTKNQSKALNLIRRKKRQAVSLPSMLWPKLEPIPFYIDSSIDVNTSKLIKNAIDFWQNNTCLNFIENSSAPTRIKFYKGTGCSSFVGRITGEQSISLGSRCNYFGIISHEIAHSLGLFHYQSRPDRDEYIDILWNNVPSSWESNLQKEPQAITLGMPYEYGSIMHYAEKDSDLVQLLAKDPRYQRTMGNRDHPTFNDVLLINKLYSCEKGFGGPDCSQPAPPEFSAKNCGGILQANDEWQTLNGETGENSKDVKERQAACHWHISSPFGTRIYIKVTAIQGACSLGCFYGSTEIKLGNFTLTGIRLCCYSDLKQESEFITDRNLAVISVHSQLSITKFSLMYKIV
uniref:Zinc metalloproteinase n=1 Tax=Panagrolaimus superbus TaxID=310955 RepID=A0A914Z3K1_9BILA